MVSKLLVTGASGDLGAPLVRLAARTWTVTAAYYSRPERVPAGDPVRVDLRGPDAARRLIDAVQPDVIIHTALSDRCADMADIGRAARLVADAAARTGCRLIFMSTDMVFDGSRPPYTEDALPDAISPYGQAKAHAERAIAEAAAEHVIVRTSLIYDFTPANRQVGWMADRIAHGAPVPLFADEIRQPIWAWNLSEALLELATLSYTGVLHVAGPERLNRWDYGRALLDAMGLAERAQVQRALAAEVAPDRPLDLTLDLGRAQRLLKTRLLSLEEARAAWQRQAQ